MRRMNEAIKRLKRLLASRVGAIEESEIRFFASSACSKNHPLDL
jgi:hypothetical protein